jgi:hypothetical protein
MKIEFDDILIDRMIKILNHEKIDISYSEIESFIIESMKEKIEESYILYKLE